MIKCCSQGPQKDVFGPSLLFSWISLVCYTVLLSDLLTCFGNLDLCFQVPALQCFILVDPLLLLLLLLLLPPSCFRCVWLCATQTAAHQAPLSPGFSRQEHWSGLPFPSPMHESEKWKWSYSVVSETSQPHGLQPTRLFCLWDFPGKNTGVGCPCLLRVDPLPPSNLES